jgi:uncharacterized protein (TIGR02996 family)
MTHDEAFLQAILDEPDDDTPRLIYADWLEERGDPRGEFIRLQCLIEKNKAGIHWLPALRRRERELLTQAHLWGLNWILLLGKNWKDKVVYRRGFVASIALSAHEFILHAQQIFRATPIQEVALSDLNPTRLMGSPEGEMTDRGWYWLRDTIPWQLQHGLFDHGMVPSPYERPVSQCFKTRKAALKLLSAICVAYGRARAKELDTPTCCPPPLPPTLAVTFH